MSDLFHQITEIALNLHEDQVRKEVKIPYAWHPIDVAKTLALWNVKEDSIIVAALLHDVLEDTEITVEELRKLIFEKEGYPKLSRGMIDTIVSIVEDLTRTDDSFEGKKNYLMSWADSKSKVKGALLIKFADRYCNIKDFWATSRSYAPKYALKGWWIYQGVFKYFADSDTLTWLIEPLKEVDTIIQSRYRDISIWVPSCESKVEEILWRRDNRRSNNVGDKS